ncbi:MAG: hypothetical protein GC161_10985 [Planctomycetaceae bacterium]|nr:hypothetical protein [Planctomycetaceae bacterium]
MHPILIDLGGFPLRSFGVMVALGFLIGSQWLWPRLLRRYGLEPSQDALRCQAVAFWILVGVLVGGRAMYVIVELFRYLAGSTGENSFGARLAERPWEAIYIWKGGMAMYGGFAGAVLFGVWSARKNGLDVATGLDTGLTAGFLGQAIGRVGCLLVGDDYGRVVPPAWRDAPFPVTITVPDLAWLKANTESLFDHELAGQVLWATQPWMSAKALILLGIGLWLLPRRRYRGQVALVLLLGYGILRFLVEMFRGDAVRGLWFDGAISTSQLISIPLVLGAGFLLWRWRGRKDPKLAAAKAAA